MGVPAAVAGTQESHTGLRVMVEDYAIEASWSRKVPQSVPNHKAPFPPLLQAPLPSVKFVEEAATHLEAVAALEEQLQLLGAALSEQLQALVKNAADEASALVSSAGKPDHQATSSWQARGLEVSPVSPAVAGSSWRRRLEDSDQLDSPARDTTNWANGCSSQARRNSLTHKWSVQHLDHL